MIKPKDKELSEIFTRIATTKKAFKLSPDEAFLCSSCIMLIIRTAQSPMVKLKAAQQMYEVMGDELVADLIDRLNDHLKESVDAVKGLDNG